MRKEKEKWSLIRNGYYAVSTNGRVMRKKPGRATYVGKILRPANNKGYKGVCLSYDGREEYVEIHVLVAEAFLGPCPEGHEVNHKDGKTGNCYYKNLEYLTYSDNQKHAYRLGLKKRQFGELNPFAKLTKEDVIEIRKLPLTRAGRIRRGYAASLANKLKVSAQQIGAIKHGYSWKG